MQNGIASTMFVLAVAVAGCGGASAVASGSTTASKCTASNVGISRPLSGDVDGPSVHIEGAVDSACADVWVVVHPLNNPSYYVQPKPLVGSDGSWVAAISIGEGQAGAGETFEVVALVNPEAPLAEGVTLTTWPSAEARSKALLLTRKPMVAESLTAASPEGARSGAPGEPEITNTEGGMVPGVAVASTDQCRPVVVDPADGGKGGDRTTVRVAVGSDCASKSVWVIAHPTAVSTYWVQPRPSLKQGEWKVDIHLGRPGIDWGQKFEIKAIVEPSQRLAEGMQLDYWPEARAESDPVEITKKR